MERSATQAVDPRNALRSDAIATRGGLRPRQKRAHTCGEKSTSNERGLHRYGGHEVD